MSRNNSGKKSSLIEIIIVIVILAAIFGGDEEEKSNTSNPTATSTQYVSNETEKPVDYVPTIKPTSIPTNLSEREYKDMCEEYYNDDFFKDTPENHAYVKFYGFTGNKYKYSASDIQGILVEDITDEYNLERNCIGCTVMHESTKNDTSPSYFGDSIYIMFEKDGKFKFDDMMSGKYITVYGEIIQNKNGIYILPKYIEYTK